MAKAKLPGEAVLKNPKHELFCWLYAGYHNRDLFGNGTRCYIQAYYADEIIKLDEEIEKFEKEKEKASLASTDRAELIQSNKKYDNEINPRQRRIKSLEKTARTMAADLLAKTGIRARVDYLVDTYIENSYTDRELQYTILQRFDLNSKVQAIKEYNRLKDRGKVGNLEGNFTFSWENAPEGNTGAQKKPVLKKAEIKQKESVVEWGNEK